MQGKGVLRIDGPVIIHGLYGLLAVSFNIDCNELSDTKERDGVVAFVKNSIQELLRGFVFVIVNIYVY